MDGSLVLKKLSEQPVHSAKCSHITGVLCLIVAALATRGSNTGGNIKAAVIKDAHFKKSLLVKPFFLSSSLSSLSSSSL